MSCGFKIETISGRNDYVSRLLLSERTFQPAIVMCDEDQSFQEVYSMVKRTVKTLNLTATQIVKIFNNIYTEICDLAPDGSKYNMSGDWRCPNCNSVLHYGPTNPPKYVEADPVTITHMEWDGLSSDERMKLIRKLVKDKYPDYVTSRKE